MSAPLAKALCDFLYAIEESRVWVPENVRRILSAVDCAANSSNPRTTLNRSIANLRRHRPGCFAELGRWLRRSEISRAATRHGASWARMVWVESARAIDAGVTAHKAFGMDKPGRPKFFRFTKGELAAFHVELQRRRGACETEQELIETAATMTQAKKTEVQKAMPLASCLRTRDLEALDPELPPAKMVELFTPLPLAE